MSINLDLNKTHLQNTKLNLHYLPAKIHGDGEANVNNYFNNYTTEEHGYMRNALRGFPLYGKNLDVPCTFKGVVLQETQRPLGNTEERQLKTTGTFDQFSYWNYDKIPTKADHYRQSLQWLTISEALAKTVTAEQIEAEMSNNALSLQNE